MYKMQKGSKSCLEWHILEPDSKVLCVGVPQQTVYIQTAVRMSANYLQHFNSNIRS